MNGLVTTGLKVSASLDVLGWNSDESVLNESMAAEIVRYVKGALGAGLGQSEIEADLTEAWGTTFSDISVEITRSFRKASALVFAVVDRSGQGAAHTLAGTALA